MAYGDGRGAIPIEVREIAPVELSEQDAANLVASQFPDLAPVTLRTINAGRDGKTFDLAGRFVFRFPNRAEIAAQLEGEVELLPHLAPHLPVKVPEITHLGRASSRFPFGFIGYPRIPGVTLEVVRRRSVDVKELGSELAAFLTALHAFPPTEARAAGVGSHSPARDLAALRARARALSGPAHKDLPDDLATKLGRFLAEDAPLPPPFMGPLVLAHNDLGASHVLVDPSSGRLSGVVDWGDVGLGDPAVDLAGVWGWLGAPLLDAIAARYAGPLDDGALARARFVGACLGVFELAHGLQTENRERVAAAIHTLSFASKEGVLAG